jgi:hypothetical protein
MSPLNENVLFASSVPISTRGHVHTLAAGVPWFWAHTRRGVPGEGTRDRREPGDGAAVDDRSKVVAASEAGRRRNSSKSDARKRSHHETAEVARWQSSPYTGKLSARPAGKPGDFFIVKGEFATIPSSPLLSAPANKKILGVQYAFLRHVGTIWSDVISKSKPKTQPWGGPCRLPLVGPRAQVAERAGRITLHLIVRR